MISGCLRARNRALSAKKVRGCEGLLEPNVRGWGAFSKLFSYRAGFEKVSKSEGLTPHFFTKPSPLIPRESHRRPAPFGTQISDFASRGSRAKKPGYARLRARQWRAIAFACKESKEGQK